MAKTFQGRWTCALKKINLQIVSYHRIFKNSTHMTTCLVVAFPFISSTNPLLIRRETQPKRILVRESEAQIWKIHPFSSFYYHTIILSSTLSVSIVCNSPWTEKVDTANGWHVPPVVTRYDYGSSADCKHQSHRDLTGSPQRELVLS